MKEGYTAMVTIPVHLTEDQYQAIQKTASLKKLSVAEFMQQVTLDRLEELQDYKDGINVLEEGNESMSRKDVLKAGHFPM